MHFDTWVIGHPVIRNKRRDALQQIDPFDALKTPCFRETEKIAKAPPARKVSVKNQSEFTQPTESSRIRQRCESICTAFQRRAPVFRPFRANEESLRTFRSSNKIITRYKFSLRLGPAQIAHLVHEIRVFACTGPSENEVESRPASGSICSSVYLQLRTLISTHSTRNHANRPVSRSSERKEQNPRPCLLMARHHEDLARLFPHVKAPQIPRE